MNIIKHAKYWFISSGILIVLTISLFFVKKIPWGIEFTGGSVTTISFSKQNLSQITELAKQLDLQSMIRESDSLLEITTRELSLQEADNFQKQLTQLSPEIIIKSATNIGPSLGKSLAHKSIKALIGMALVIILAVGISFDGVSLKKEDEEGNILSSVGPSAFIYGMISVVTLLHDALIPIGITLLMGIPITGQYVVGVLSILGLSINDTVVVFDRIRENLRKESEKRTLSSKDFAHIVGKSLSETVFRSLATSLIVVVALFSLWYVGPNATKDLALVLFFGMLFGTYSSIFIASPLLIVVNNFFTKNTNKK
jgi:preprotein translocase subunit SecF